MLEKNDPVCEHYHQNRRTLCFGKYVILVCLRLSTRMSFMGRLDTPSFVADLNAWIVVLCSEHEEYRETVDLTS